MKLFGTIAKSMKKLSYIVFIFILHVSWVVRSQSEFTPIPADTSFKLNGFDVIADSIHKYRLVLTGENHRFVNSNQIIKLKMILFLHEHGFRYHLLELGRGIGYLANEYIRTGDEQLMNILNDGVENELNPMFEMLMVLERFNRELPDEDKIQIHGVDYTRYPFFLRNHFNILLKNWPCKTS